MVIPRSFTSLLHFICLFSIANVILLLSILDLRNIIWNLPGFATMLFTLNQIKKICVSLSGSQKSNTGSMGRNSKMISLTQNYLYTLLLQFSSCSSVSHGTVILQWATKTTLPRGYRCVWYVAILHGPKH